MRNKILYVICLAYFVAGWSVYTMPDVSLDLIRQADPSITAHTDMFTLNQIGLIFMIASTVAVLLAVFKKKTDWGYSLMTFVLVWWSLLYIVSWYQTGYWQSIYGLVNYGLTATILILCSRIIEMPKGMRESSSTPLPIAELDIRLKGEDS